MSSQGEPVIVVGSGMGGMASAISLAAAGMPVEVHESAAGPGGKLRAVEVGGQRLDAGPTVLTMRGVFDSLLAAGGEELGTLLKPAGVLARHYWPDGSALDLHADPEQSAAAIGEFAGAAEARRFQAFMAEARGSARLLQDAFLEQLHPTPLRIALATLRRDPSALLRLNPFSTLWGSVERAFRDARLQQLFGRYATYCGSDPWQAPATLAMIVQVEADGVWLIEDGLYPLARALESSARSLGVQFHYGSRVESLELDPAGIAGVRLAGGERRAARQVVFNGDARALATGLLGQEARQRARIAGTESRSLSAITWNLLAKAEGAALSHHNVFFSDDYRREFQSLFASHAVPDVPTVYICAQDRLEEDAAPGDAERLLCLVNAPALRADSRDNDAFPPGGLAECEAMMRRQLARCGLALQDQTPGVATTPADFARLFPGSRGALYGMATHGWKAAFTRPKARSRIPGLYLAGGSVHPGPGLPMAALSGLHAAGCALADRGSTRTWRKMATRGGTSMPWATIPPAD